MEKKSHDCFEMVYWYTRWYTGASLLLNSIIIAYFTTNRRGQQNAYFYWVYIACIFLQYFNGGRFEVCTVGKEEGIVIPMRNAL